MALTFAGLQIDARIVMIDFGGQKDTFTLNTTATDAATADTLVRDVAEKLKAVTTCQIFDVAYQLKYTNIGDDGLGVTNDAPIYGAEREHRGVLEVTLDNGSKYKLTYPAPAEAVLDATDRDKIDSANANIAALIALYQSGGGLVIGESGAVVVGSPDRAYTQHRVSRTKTEKIKLG